MCSRYLHRIFRSRGGHLHRCFPTVVVVTGNRILVVDDDQAIAEAVTQRLRADGHEVEAVGDGEAAVAAAGATPPDLVVLDLGLPGIDGVEVCRRLRAAGDMGIVMLTARDDETDMLIGLGVGADDYMVKPFSPRELSARVATVLRRTAGAADRAPSEPDTLSAGPYVIDVARRRVCGPAGDIHLTVTEFDLLVDLARADGAVRSRDQLMRQIWGYRDAGVARTIDSHVRAIRRKLDPELVRTIHGIGYALSPTEPSTSPPGDPAG